MISAGEDMTFNQAKAEIQLEEFQQRFRSLDQWAKEIRSCIKHGDGLGLAEALKGMSDALVSLRKKGVLE